jgi:predicted transcriptional regulator
MKIPEIAQLINAEICTKNHNPEIDILSACSADLMSDVMAFSKANALLLTGLVNPQVIRTAEMMDIKAVIFVRGKKPLESMIDMAEEKGIALLATDFPLFVASGKLYKNGIHGSGE